MCVRDWIPYNCNTRQMVYKTPGDKGEQLFRGKAVVLLGNPETGRIAVMLGDYYWLEVTSCPPPHEAHHCRTCEGCCVESSPGNPPLRRNEGLLMKGHLNTLRRGMLCDKETTVCYVL